MACAVAWVFPRLASAAHFALSFDWVVVIIDRFSDLALSVTTVGRKPLPLSK